MENSRQRRLLAGAAFGEPVERRAPPPWDGVERRREAVLEVICERGSGDMPSRVGVNRGQFGACIIGCRFSVIKARAECGGAAVICLVLLLQCTLPGIYPPSTTIYYASSSGARSPSKRTRSRAWGLEVNACKCASEGRLAAPPNKA